MTDAAQALRADYAPAERLRRLRDEAREPVRERTPRVRMRRTVAGALVPEVPVSESELPAFLRARR